QNAWASRAGLERTGLVQAARAAETRTGSGRAATGGSPAHEARWIQGNVPAVDTAIAIGQGAGVALACGITAAVPLAVAAICALLIGLPGDRSQLDDGWLVAVACA